MQRQLINYIAPGAPATRRPATGNEPHLRLELGFTPKWYRQHADVDFGERWHRDPAYRTASLASMREVLKQRFPGTGLGERVFESDDVLTGTFGVCPVAAIFGFEIAYSEDNWPTTKSPTLSDADVDSLETPDLGGNPFFQDLLAQLDWIAANHGPIAGFINWQGVLNTAMRLRGEQVFMDMLEAPDRTRRLFDRICETMIKAIRTVQERQRTSGFDMDFATVSNCVVNMVSPETYAEHLLPFDRRIAEEFGLIGVHNCSWRVDPYIDAYASIPDVGYIDMGMESDLVKVQSKFPNARRAAMITPMDLAEKSSDELKRDFTRINEDLGPCDIVCGGVESSVPDERIMEAFELCRRLSEA